ncbi:MAG: site-specific integrase, partial [Actinomycetota bacterium]
RQALRQAPTVDDLAERHLREHARIKNKPKSAEHDQRAWERCVLPALGKRKAKDVTRADIAKLITGMSETPAMANKVLTLLSKAFNLAEVWGWRPEGTNPCRHVGRYKEESRERYLSESELRRLGEVLAEAQQTWDVAPQAIAAIRLLLVTGCRSSEILNLRWDDIDFEHRCLYLRDSKTGKRTVVLNDSALDILANLERVDGNPYVVPGLKPDTRRSTLQPLWKRIREAAGLNDVRIHDLRHTFGSVGVNSGHSLAIIGRLLGHTKILTTQRYAHLADGPVREATENIGAVLADSMGHREAETTRSTSRLMEPNASPTNCNSKRSKSASRVRGDAGSSSFASPKDRFRSVP